MQLCGILIEVRPDDCDEDVLLFEALIALLHTRPSLRTLVLDAECLCRLSSSSILPQLEKLELCWSVPTREGSLSWLRARLPGQLHVRVTLYDGDDGEDEGVVDSCCQALQQLQDLPIYVLRIDVDADDPNYHAIWESPQYAGHHQGPQATGI